MKKCIPVANCTDCPNKDHAGAFGAVAYVPLCRAVGKRLPYTTSEGGAGARGSGGRLYASATPGIPDWCPLPNYPEQ